MEKILDRLSFDDFQMGFQDYQNTGEYKLLDKQEQEAFHKLEEILGDRKSLLNEWISPLLGQECLERSEVFRKGFALAVRLLLEAMEEQF